MEMNNWEWGGGGGKHHHGREIQYKELPGIKAMVIFLKILTTTDKSQASFWFKRKWRKK